MQLGRYTSTGQLFRYQHGAVENLWAKLSPLADQRQHFDPKALPALYGTPYSRRAFDARVREQCKSLDISLAFTYGAPNHTNTRLRNALAVLALLLFTFVCAALHLGFARGDDYCEPMVDTFFFNAMTPMPHPFGAAQAA